MDLMTIINTSISFGAIGIMVVLSIQMRQLKRNYAQDIQSTRELFKELETKFTKDNSMQPKPAFGIPPRQNNHSYKKPVLQPENEKKPPPPAKPLKTKRW